MNDLNNFSKELVATLKLVLGSNLRHELARSRVFSQLHDAPTRGGR